MSIKKKAGVANGQRTLCQLDDNFIMLPTVDFVFKLLFGDISHKERLIDLLGSILRLPKTEIAGLEIINTELPKLFEEDKKGILDIRIKLPDEKQIDVEIQVLPTIYMPERTLYYWSKMYTLQTKAGDTFDQLKKCITINILDYSFLPIEKMHTVFHITEDETGYRLTDILEVHFCELEKIRENRNIRDISDPAVEWLKFIGAKTKGEMEMIAKNNEVIKDAYEYLQIISKDEEKRLAYEARQAWIMDQRTREKLAHEEGMKEGERKKALAIARSLLGLLDLETIAAKTGLDIDSVKGLKEQ